MKKKNVIVVTIYLYISRLLMYLFFSNWNKYEENATKSENGLGTQELIQKNDEIKKPRCGTGKYTRR